MTTSEDRNALSPSEQLHNFMTSVNESQPVSEVDPAALRLFNERLVEHSHQPRSDGAGNVSNRSRSFMASPYVPRFFGEPGCAGRMAARHGTGRCRVPSGHNDSSQWT